MTPVRHLESITALPDELELSCGKGGTVGRIETSYILKWVPLPLL